MVVSAQTISISLVGFDARVKGSLETVPNPPF